MSKKPMRVIPAPKKPQPKPPKDPSEAEARRIEREVRRKRPRMIVEDDRPDTGWVNL